MKNDFKSFLAVEFSNYLQLLLSAGRSTRNHEIMLRSLDSFLLQNHTFEKGLSESIINQWLSTICGTSANTLEDMGLDVERLCPVRKDWNDDLCAKFERKEKDA